MFTYQRMRFAHLSGFVAAALLAVSCGDPVAPTGPESIDPGSVTFQHSGTGAGLHGSGSIGPGAPTPGSDRQDFQLDIAWDLTGSLTYRDWSVVRSDGTAATVTVAAADAGTWLAAYRNGSTACADPTRGAEVDGMGRLDTGELMRFTLVVCDNAPAGSGTDVFRMAVPDAAGYERGGILSSGDIVKSDGAAPSATGTSVSGLGAIGPGTATPGSDRQDFAFEVTAAGGSITYSDYGVIRNGLPGRLVADPVSDPPTGVTSYHRTSDICVRFGGTGRLDTGELLPFYVDVCDNANPGTGIDTFLIMLPDRAAQGVHYTRSGTLSSGDIVLSGGSAPTTGNLDVTTTTTGSSLDPDGYTATVDGTTSRSVPTNGSVTFSGLAAGSHTVTLSGVAANCLVSGGDARTVNVPAGGTASAAFAVSCGAQAARLAFSVQPSTVTAGSAISPAVQVTAQDDAGNSVPTFNGAITVELGANGNGGTLSGTKTVTAVNGVATFSDLTITRAGTGYTLTAAASGLAGATSGTFSVAAGRASALFFTVQPSDTETNSSIEPAVRVTARDAYGNTATSYQGSMTMAIARNPGGGSLSGTRTVTAASGVGVFRDLRIDRAGDGYSLRVGASGLTGAESARFDVERRQFCLLIICL